MLVVCLYLLEDDRDRELFAALYRTYERKMYGIAFHILQDPQLAEDAVHDAFVKIIQSFSMCKTMPRDKVPVWIMVIVRNKAIDIIRKRKREFPSELVEQEADMCAAEEDGTTDFVDIVRKLPDTYRTVMELKYIFELTDKDIAKFLGISNAAVRTRLNRGRNMLRKRFEEASEL